MNGWASFTAGVAVGWAGRSALGSGRELLVRAVLLLHGLRDEARRVAAEQIEWVEDAFAEGAARYEGEQPDAAVGDDRGPYAVPTSQGRAA